MITETKRGRLFPFYRNSVRKYTVVRGNVVHARNSTQVNMLEGKRSPGYKLEVSRRLEVEGPVCAILRGVD